MIGAEKQATDWLELGRTVIGVEAEGLGYVRDRLGQGFLDALDILGAVTGRVVVTGIGKSGLVGRKIAATLSSTGTPSFYLHPVEGAHGDLGMIRAEDAVLAISKSGETDEVNVLLPSLRAVGVKVVGLLGKDESRMAALCDAVVNCGVPKEADEAVPAPTASTTAALAVGDALAVCLMRMNSFDEKDFRRCHPGGELGRRLCLRVSDLMHTQDIPAAPEDITLGEAVLRIDKGGLGALALTAPGGELTGILTDGDVRRTLCAGDVKPESPVADFMTRGPKSARPASSAAEVMDIMEEKAITVVPIVDENRKLVGMVHLHDLLGKGLLKFSR
jgi:arabinose-5-phosphate isomerase